MDIVNMNRLLSELIDHLYEKWEDDKIFEFFFGKYGNEFSDNDIGRVVVMGQSAGFIKTRKNPIGGNHFSLTEEGFNMMSVYGSYLAYIDNKQEEVYYKKTMQKLKKENMMLANMKLKFFIITSALSFIAGILLSDPIKRIWTHILSISE